MDNEGYEGTSGGPDQEPTRKQEPTPKESSWDIFQADSKPAKSKSYEEKQGKKLLVFMKILLCIVFFILVLGTSVLSKLALLVMTYRINAGGVEIVNNGTVGLKKRTNSFIDPQWLWGLYVTMVAPYTFSLLWTVVIWISTASESTTAPATTSAGQSSKRFYCTIFGNTIFEVLHSIALLIFVYVVLPRFDPVMNLVLFTSVCCFPAIVRCFQSICNCREGDNSCWKVFCGFINILGACSQLAVIGILTWMTCIAYGEQECWICVPLIILSLYFWPNFLPKFRVVDDICEVIRENQVAINLSTSLCKIVTTFLGIIILFGTREKGCISALFNTSKMAAGCSWFGDVTLHNSRDGDYQVWYTCVVCIISSGLCYCISVAACQVRAQIPCFSIPLALSTPVTFFFLMLPYIVDNTPDNAFGFYFNWIPPNEYTRLLLEKAKVHGPDYLWWIQLFHSWASFLLIGRHIWRYQETRMARHDSLFVKPSYCGILLDQSLVFYRASATVAEREKVIQGAPTNNDGEYVTPKVYICATMWHENETEMVQMIRSIVRLDKDHSDKKAKDRTFEKSTEYYEFEAHIFFDDAFEPLSENEASNDVNDFVKMLVRIVPEAGRMEAGRKTDLSKFTTMETPYGGRLVWTLPGSNTLTAHLKDKAKIRHRKRWSQVMYLYYFLAHQLMQKCTLVKKWHTDLLENPELVEPTDEEYRTQKKIVESTFVLALDGDVDFQPGALRLLIDRLKLNPKVGAACGRIHPIGAGPLVWYQKFEYAIGHWLQKATEHVLGCVLCSPGCFSLFRGSALMDENVMRKYATLATDAKHYVQYDQGEDRWLCTLLLQQGYQVEYSAASDSYTYAPEGFNEFYNQRRRWTPSTLANVADLLSNWRGLTHRNDRITKMYIAYQGLMLFSTILTPGTIFMLLVGAISAVYPVVPLYGSFIFNLLLVVPFVIVVFTAKTDTQLKMAAILSVIYSIVMVLVVAGLIKHIYVHGYCSITTILFLCVVGIFVITGSLHPKEVASLLWGIFYFLAIPSMSLLLTIYSLGNLHVVSWGTRESPKPVTARGPPTKASGTGVAAGFKQSHIFQRLTGTIRSLFCICCPTIADVESLVQHPGQDLHQPVRIGVDENNGVDIQSELQSVNNDANQNNGNDGRPNNVNQNDDNGRQDDRPLWIRTLCSDSGQDVSTFWEGIIAKSNEKLTFWQGIQGMVERNEQISREENIARSKAEQNDWQNIVATLKDGQTFWQDIIVNVENEQKFWGNRDNDTNDEAALKSAMEIDFWEIIIAKLNAEQTFWPELIDKYLLPIEKNESKEKKVSKDLLELRNNTCLGIFLFNTILVVFIFVMQKIANETPGFAYEFPCHHKRFVGENIEAISGAFLGVFGILLLIQFAGMLVHRVITFLHISADTLITGHCCCKCGCSCMEEENNASSSSNQGTDESEEIAQPRNSINMTPHHHTTTTTTPTVTPLMP